MYETFFGLNGKPFQLSPDPSFYFASKGHRKAFSYLEYGVVQGEGFIVITGEIGAGKTTMVRSLLQRLDPARVVAAQLVSTHLGGDDLLRAVATTFGINVRHGDKARLIADIEAFLMALVVARKRPLLLVDEAQNLKLEALEELRMLSNFQLGALQSFLIGQPELRTLMRLPETEQFRQRIIASYHLGPLNEAEVRAYIEHRLRRVGWNGDPAFDAAAFEAIFSFTGGIPRRINKVCERLLLSAFLAETRRIGVASVDEVIAELAIEEPPMDRAHPAPSLGRPAAAAAAVGPTAAAAPRADAEAATSSPDTPDVLARSIDAMEGHIRQLRHSVLELSRLVEPQGVTVGAEQPLPASADR